MMTKANKEINFSLSRMYPFHETIHLKNGIYECEMEVYKENFFISILIKLYRKEMVINEFIYNKKRKIWIYNNYLTDDMGMAKESKNRYDPGETWPSNNEPITSLASFGKKWYIDKWKYGQENYMDVTKRRIFEFILPMKKLNIHYDIIDKILSFFDVLYLKE